jgi:hypothetical protein
MELIIRTFDLLQHTFSISRKSINTQPTAIVELRWEGIQWRGYFKPYYNITIDNIVADLEK